MNRALPLTRAALWAAVGALVASAHVEAAAWAMRQVPPGLAVPPDAVMIELAAMPAPPQPAAEPVSQSAPEVTPEPVADPPSEPEPEPEPAPEPEPQPVPESQPEAQPEPEQVTLPAFVPPPMMALPPPDFASLPPPPPAPAVPQVSAERPRAKPPVPVARTRAPEPERREARAAPRQEPAPRAEPPRPREPQPQAQARQAPRQQAAAPPANRGAGQPAAGKPSARAMADWQGQVQRRVAAHMARANLSGGRGGAMRATIQISVAGNGSARGQLVSGAGDARIDRALSRQASRMPRLPAPPGGQPQSLTVPVEIAVR